MNALEYAVFDAASMRIAFKLGLGCWWATHFKDSDLMSSVRVKENEPFDVALRRFKRLIEKTGLLNDLRAREYYEKPTWERKRKAAAAVKRQYRRLRNQTLPAKLY